MAPRPEWWWILSKYNGRCQQCGNSHGRADVVAYNHEVRAIRCAACVEHEGIQPGLSKKLRGSVAT